MGWHRHYKTWKQFPLTGFHDGRMPVRFFLLRTVDAMRRPDCCSCLATLVTFRSAVPFAQTVVTMPRRLAGRLGTLGTASGPPPHDISIGSDTVNVADVPPHCVSPTPDDGQAGRRTPAVGCVFENPVWRNVAIIGIG